jgi:hypothetical protein
MLILHLTCLNNITLVIGDVPLQGAFGVLDSVSPRDRARSLLILHRNAEFTVICYDYTPEARQIKGKNDLRAALALFSASPFQIDRGTCFSPLTYPTPGDSLSWG